MDENIHKCRLVNDECHNLVCSGNGPIKARVFPDISLITMQSELSAIDFVFNYCPVCGLKAAGKQDGR